MHLFFHIFQYIGIQEWRWLTSLSWFLFHLIFEIFSALTTAYYFLPDSTCFSLYFHMLCYYFCFFFHPFTAGLKLSFLPLAKHSFVLPNLWEPTFYLFQDALIPLHVFHRTLPEIPVRSEIKSELKISTKIKHVILSFDYLKSWMTGHIIENTFVCVNFCCIKNPDELFFCMLAIILLIFFWYFLFESISVTFPFMFSCVVEKQLFYCSLFLKYLEFWEIAGAGAPSAISRA